MPRKRSPSILSRSKLTGSYATCIIQVRGSVQAANSVCWIMVAARERCCPCLRRRGFSDSLAGCDISREMVNEAQSRLNLEQTIDLRPMNDANAPFGNGEFDVVVLSSVLHHVDFASRNNVYADALRLLKTKRTDLYF